MIRFTLVRPGPRHLMLNPAERTLQVQLQQRVLHLTLNRSTTVISPGGAPPEPDVDFLLAYQISKL